jgi:hypothetical protein
MGLGAGKLLLVVVILLVIFAPIAVLLFFAVHSLRVPANVDMASAAPNSSDVERRPDPFDVTRWSEDRVRALMAGAVMPFVMLPVLVVALSMTAADRYLPASQGHFFGVVCGQLLLAALSIAMTVLMIVIMVKSPISTTSKVWWAIAILWGSSIAIPFAAYHLVWKPWKTASDSRWELEESAPG